MKNIMKKCGAIILTVAMLTTGMSGFSDAKVAKAVDDTDKSNIGETVIADNGVKFIEYKDIKNYRLKKTTITESYTDGDVVNECYAQSPKLSGYVFAGWFTDSKATSYIGTEIKSGSAWAKFVPQKTFTIKAQIRDSEGTKVIDTKDVAALNDVEKVDLRFITGIDSLKYRRVIFSATHLGREVNRGMNKVMTELDNKPGETGATEGIAASSVFGTTANYFATLRYTGIKAQAQRFLQDWTIIPKLITQDGTLVEGITRDEFKIQDAVSKKFQVTDGSTDITPNTTTASVVANVTDTNVHQLFLKGVDGTRYSKSWEISGAFTNLTGNALKGFTIQADDAAEIADKTTKYYTMHQDGVAVDEANTSLGTNILPEDLQVNYKNVWATTRYKAGINATEQNESTYVRFKAVLIEDVLSLWIDDELVWQLPLTDANFGGFEAGSSYRIALCCQGTGTKVSWTDLKVKYGDDVKPYKFFMSDRRNYNAMDEGVSVDNTSGKVTVNLDDQYSKRIWLKNADGVDSSTNWEITGTMKVLVPLVKGFTIRDDQGRTGNYSLGWWGVALNEYEIGGNWDVVTDNNYVVATETYKKFDSDLYGSYRFKLVIQKDELKFYLENEQIWEQIWNLPLTEEKFGWRDEDEAGNVTKGGFAPGSSYRVALRGLDEGGQMEWSDLKVNCGNRFSVASKTDDSLKVDTVAGKVTVDTMQDSGVKHLYFANADGVSSSQNWEITGTFKEIDNLMKGFTIQSADGGTTGFYTVYLNGVSLNQNWGYPVSGGWNVYNIDGKYVFANADTIGKGDGGDRFKLVIQDDIFSFWVEDQLIWQLPLTDSRFGTFEGTPRGFAAGTSYKIAIRHLDPGQAEWSDLKVKCGDDVEPYKFLVHDITNAAMIADTINGKVTVNSTSAVNRLWFATNNNSYASKNWEITGNYKQFASIMKGFTIQSADGTKTGHYTVWTNGISLNERWSASTVNTNYAEGTNEYHWNVHFADEEHVFTNARYNAMAGINDNIRFRVVLSGDVLRLWIDDELVWDLPLTESLYGGFTAGTYYRFALRHIDAGQAEWSDLTVKHDRFFVAKDGMTSGVTADTMGGTAEVQTGDKSTSQYLFFGTADGNDASQSWEITGNFEQLTNFIKGFAIQSSDGTKKGYYTFWPNGVALNEYWGSPKPDTSGATDAAIAWNVYSVDSNYVFANEHYDLFGNTGHTGYKRQFRAVIKNDIFSLWVNDQLVWQLPLTNATFGYYDLTQQKMVGFSSGTSYKIAIRCSDKNGVAEWSDLTVKYGEQVH